MKFNILNVFRKHDNNLSITHTHAHNRFTALLDFVQDYPGVPSPER